MTDSNLAVAELEPSAQRTRSWLWVAVGVLLVVAVGAAFLTGGDERSPEARFRAVTGAVADAETFSYEMTFSTSAGPMNMDMTMQGAVDVVQERTRATIAAPGSTIEMISDGDVLYVKLPEQARADNAGKPWVRVSLEGVAQGFGGAGVGTSPLDSFEQLASPGAEIERVGEEDVRGTPTTHYRTRLDLAAAAASAGGPLATTPGIEAMKDVPVDVWLDADDRPRRQRIEISMPMGAAAAGGNVNLVTTIEAFGYGEPVTIEIPPADQVHDNPAGLGGLGSLFGGAATGS